MDTALKYKIVEKIIQTDDDALLNEITALIGLSEGDFWDNLPNEIKKGIDKAKSELDNGEGIPDNEITAEVKTRFLIK